MKLDDFYVANVMSEPFRPPTDPHGASHTLGQLCAATVEDGQPSPHLLGSPRIQIDYGLRLEWAPVVTKASTTTLDPNQVKEFPHFVELAPNISGESIYTTVPRPFMYITVEKIGGVAFLNLAIVAERDNWVMNSGRIRLDSVARSSEEKRFVAATAQTYFDQFKGWTMNGDIWVPPTAEPADGSA